MKRLLAAVAVCSVLQLGAGCHHVGGECDCAPIPGDSVGINPHVPGYGAATMPPSAVHVEPGPAPKTIPPLR